MDIAPARDEGARIGLANGQAADAIAFREKHLKERAQQPGPSRALSSECLPVLSPPPTTPAPRPPPRLRTLSIDPLVPSSTFDERFKDRLRAVKHANDEVEVHTAEASPTSNTNGDDRILTREWRAPSGKRIVVPVRIEPKVYFATERTFLVRAHPLLLLPLYNSLTLLTFAELAALFYTGFSARHCSRSPRCSQLFTQLAFSCTARCDCADAAPRAYTMTSTAQPHSVLLCSAPW